MNKKDDASMMGDKKKINLEYLILTVIIFTIIFVLVVGIYFICFNSEAEVITLTTTLDKVSFIDEKDSPKPQLKSTNIKKVSKESKNTPQVNKPKYTSIGKFRLTAYCPCNRCCEQYANNRPKDKDGNNIVYTASGKIAKVGYTIAADTSILPYGTIVYINGHKYEVQDCGGSIKGNRIDVYFNSHEEACEFGVQYADVFKIS